MVHQKQGHGFIALFEPSEQVEGRSAGFGGQNAISRTIFAPQIAFDGAQNVGIVVDGQ